MHSTVAEELTANFYLWEQRARGWSVWDIPVDLEPPFEPFSFSYYFPTSSVIDDGHKSTFLSSLADRLKAKLLGATSDPEGLAPPEEIPVEVSPGPFECEHPLREIVIRLPSDAKITPDYAEQLLLNLSSCTWPLSFEVVGSAESISIQLACREPDFVQVRAQVQAVFPEVTLNEGMNLSRMLGEKGEETVVVDFGLDQEFMRPLRTFRSFDPDPLVGIFGALENLGQGGRGCLQILFRIASRPWAESIIRAVSDADGSSFFADAPEMPSLAREKIRRPLFSVVLRAVGQGSSQARAWEIVRSIAGGLSTFAKPDSNELIPLTNEGYDDPVHFEDVLLRRTRRSGMLLNTEELTSLLHFPSAAIRSPKLRGEYRKSKAAPPIAEGHDFILGENVHQGIATKVSLSKEQRLRHIHVIGATGTGKSTLLLRMILQDLERGNGCAVLDPHGDLIDRVVELVPEERFEDVVLFDPADTDYPVGFNILEARSEVEKNVLSSDLAALFRRFSTSWGDQMTTILGNAVSVFLESSEGGTLMDLRRFLIEKDYRAERLKGVHDPEIVYFWEKQFPLLKGTALSSILTRLDIFLRPKIIRHIVGQRGGLDCDEIVNTRKIFLVKLAQGLIGEENAHLLGSLLVSKLHQVALGRQEKRIEEREPFFLYIDEFQHFITPSMASVLEGARKFGLGIVASHQSLRQLWDENTQLATSLITNPVTRICFRLGDFDAEKFQGGFSYFDASDLKNLGVGEAIVRVERSEYDFNLSSYRAPSVASEVASLKREKIVTLTRERYGRAMPRAEIPASQAEYARIPITPVEKSVPRAPSGIREEFRPEPRPTLAAQKEFIPSEDLTTQKSFSQHRYLQTLIKRMAEQRGYRAVTEEPTSDGSGRVDVGLEREGKRIACEISVTTNDVHELQNIEKCLKAGYEKVLVCSPDKKNLDAIQRLTSEKLEIADREKVLFFSPDELFLFLEEQAAQQLSKEERIKGYRVKVQYQAVSEVDKKKKQEELARVIASSLRRIRGRT
jgi:hypothetical protein